MIIELNRKPFVPERWSIVYNLNLDDWDCVEQMDLGTYVSKHQLGEGKVTGFEIKKETTFLYPANAYLLDLFLEETNLIPVSIRDLCPLFFFGTVYKDETGRECVRCLCENEGNFYWRWRWLSDFWRFNNPALIMSGCFNKCHFVS